MLPPSRPVLLSAFLLVGQRCNAFCIAPKAYSSLSNGAKLGSTPRIVASQKQSFGRTRGSRVMMSTMQETIESRLKEALSPVHLEVINESHMHSGPATESHFKVVVVTDEFEGKSLLARHRMVNTLFMDEMTGEKPKMHALSIQGKTSSQWEAEGHKVMPSPPCMGGSKADPMM